MPIVTFVMDFDPTAAKLEELQHPPYTALEGVLATTFAITEARVHIMSGALKASGHPTSEVGSDTWTGTLSYDHDPGIYELWRGPRYTKGGTWREKGRSYHVEPHGGTGDSHFFFDPVEARWPGDWTTGDSFQMYTKVILDWLED